MNRKEVTQKLCDLYAQYAEQIGKLRKEINEQDKDIYLCNPFLNSVTETAAKQKTIIMLVGKEPNDWHDYNESKGHKQKYDNFYGHNDIERFMKYYEEFDAAKDDRLNSSPFWQMARDLEKAIGNESFSIITSNVLQMFVASKSKLGHPVSTKIEDKLQPEDILRVAPLIQAQIDIIQPDILVFVSSYHYDKYLKAQIKDTTFTAVEGFDKDHLAYLSSPNIKAKLALRTYHPKFLNFNRKDIRDKVIELVRG